MASKSCLLAVLLLATTSNCLGHYNARAVIHGKHLIVGVAHEVPTFIKSKNGTNVTFTGMGVRVLQLLAQELKFTFSFVELSQEDYQEFGIPQTAINGLLRGEFDMIGNFMILSHNRSMYMDFTKPIAVEDYNLVQAMPQLDNEIPIPGLSIDQTWLWFLLTAMVMIVLLGLNGFVSNQSASIWARFSDAFFFVFSTANGQGWPNVGAQLCARIICGSWILAMIVLINRFNSEVTSRLSAPKFEPIIESFEQLANSSSVHIIVGEGTILDRIIKNSTTGVFGRLASSLQKYPNHTYTHDKEMMSLLLSGKCALPSPNTAARFYVDSTMKTAGQCLLTMSKPLDLIRSFSFTLAKNSPYTEGLNMQIQYFWENGLLSHRPKFIKRLSPCNQLNRPIHSERQSLSLSLSNMSSPFIVLAFGLSVSTLCFLLELIVHARMQRQKRRQPRQEPYYPDILHN